MLLESEDSARALITRALEKHGGQVVRAAADLDVSRPFLWHCMRRLGMRRVAAGIRSRKKVRYRLPPL